jgi:hypothetical protein
VCRNQRVCKKILSGAARPATKLARFQVWKPVVSEKMEGFMTVDADGFCKEATVVHVLAKSRHCLYRIFQCYYIKEPIWVDIKIP